MSEQQKVSRLTRTIGNQYYGIGLDGEKSLSINYLENNLSLGIHSLLPNSQQSTGSKYDYKSGNIIYLTGKKCKALSRFINKAKNALENNEEIKSHSIASATNLIEICDGTKFNLDKGITIVIYNNIDENKKTDEFALFQFRNDDIIIDYDHKTGYYTKSTLDTDVDYFIDNLKEFSKAWCNATAHFVKKEFDFNMNRMATRQLQCMEALGIKVESPRTARMDWNSNNNSNNGSVHTTMTSADLISELEAL